ncbi:MAG: 2-C-methyl-D-erythritol 2,4-cyclodiphosphate synthase [Hydrogenophilus sp.]|nr:2-C-methyl-D-erythritol 2,4-cyclodiphosphate synthase [Hydrogenophilus sp.]
MRGEEIPPLRVGIGFDVHALVPGRRCVIGGVTIPFERGLLGHSDGDVLTHAVIDAVLGAAGLGDVGQLFPEGEERWRGADSLRLLRLAWERVQAAGWRLVNVDGVVIAEAPRIAPYAAEMQARLAATLGVEAAQVGVKGKSFERLGALGRGEGVAAEAVALLVRAR